MKNLREHLKSIRKLEKDQHSYDQMIAYFSDDSSTLLTGLCEGGVFLPSFMLLKELKNTYQELCDVDGELSDLFNAAIKCSKLFYFKTIDLVENESSQANYRYEEKFEQITQPLGQKLVNLLANIKYRIKIVKLRDILVENNNNKLVPYSWNSIVGILYSAVAHLKYMMTLITSSNQNMARKFYYAIISVAILAFWIYNYVFLDDISFTSSVFLGVISGISVILLAIISYPIGDFGKKDISGRNIVAYKYKVLLNNRKNSKLVKLFTMQHGKNIGATLPRIVNK